MPITALTDLLDGQAGVPGQLCFPFTGTILSGINAESSTIIPYGFGVVKGSTDDDLLLPVDGNSVFSGVAYLAQIEKRASYSLDANSRFGCPIDHELAYVKQGAVLVWIDGNVTKGGAVYLSHTVSSSVKGMFRGDSNSSNALQVTGAEWLQTKTATHTAPAIAKLLINRP